MFCPAFSMNVLQTRSCLTGFHLHFLIITLNSTKNIDVRSTECRAGADPGFDRGGVQIVTGLNFRQCAAASCERSEPFSVWGLGPALGPQKLLGISLLNMHSLHFGVPFYTIFEIIKY